MSRRTMREAASPPRLSSIVWLAGLMFGVAVGIVLLYHFVLASRSGVFPSGKANAAEMLQAPAPQDDIGDAHAEALKEAAAK